MPEDDSSTPHATEIPDKRRSWLDRISSMLSGEPSTRDDLVELLRDVQADGLIAADTLKMMEGALTDRKSVVKGKSVSVRVDLGGRLSIKKKTHNTNTSAKR